MTKRPKMEDLLVDLFECWAQAPHDLGGEQREWYLPRLTRLVMGLTQWFPGDAAGAMSRAKTPYDQQENQ